MSSAAFVSPSCRMRGRSPLESTRWGSLWHGMASRTEAERLLLQAFVLPVHACVLLLGLASSPADQWSRV